MAVTAELRESTISFFSPTLMVADSGASLHERGFGGGGVAGAPSATISTTGGEGERNQQCQEQESRAAKGCLLSGHHCLANSKPIRKARPIDTRRVAKPRIAQFPYDAHLGKYPHRERMTRWHGNADLRSAQPAARRARAAQSRLSTSVRRWHVGTPHRHRCGFRAPARCRSEAPTGRTGRQLHVGLSVGRSATHVGYGAPARCGAEFRRSRAMPVGDRRSMWDWRGA